ncbi:MAG: SGNH/GDSL hydrolase family protein [Flammeovirgaceae bacterium]|nr:SGNH/GDSL hydrolase family protein [Flammeovirgaceae bacterium]
MKRYLALGDSYSIGECVQVNERWPVRLTQRLNEKDWQIESTTIIATTGWRTDNLRVALEIANLKPGYDLVSLLIGVNNQYQGKSSDDYKTEFVQLLDSAIQLSKKKEGTFVVSIPDYGFTPFGQAKQKEISRDIDLFNEINKRIAEDRGVSYFDITDISREGLEKPDLIASDGLHPSGSMYRLWVDRIVKGLTSN